MRVMLAIPHCSRNPRVQGYLIALILVCCLSLGAEEPEVIELRSGITLTGQVYGVTSDGLEFRYGEASTVLRWAQLSAKTRYRYDPKYKAVVDRRVSEKQKRARAFREADSLTDYTGLDLRSLDDPAKGNFLRLLRARLEDPADTKDPAPWFVWQLPVTNQACHFVVFEGKQIVMVPGFSYARIHLFGADWRHLNTCAFSTGWRLDLRGARMTENTELGCSVIEIATAPVINGPDITRQFYGIVGERVALLRLEDRAGQPVRNLYWGPHATIGPRPPEQTPQDWESTLGSGDPCKTLEALVWLGGSHLNPEYRDLDVVQQSLMDMKLIHSVHERVGVKLAVQDLAKSEWEWVRQAAERARTIHYRER